MTRVTRTLNPLPFQDLEPHRFEDLVRALIYDFRPWLKLEATGRSGSDDGFDARGWESTSAPSDTAMTTSLAEDDTEADEIVDFLANSRLWLIQCKREGAIGPSKLLAYLEAIPSIEREDLDGLILEAPCDFSKRSRDAFREWCVASGIGEYHLWGKSDLEDVLFQPKNDHLLFAFFGISLVVRQRSIRTELRSLLATKRKIAKVVGGIGEHVHRICLFRDPKDERYPRPPEGMILKPAGAGFSYSWFSRAVVGVQHNGIKVAFRDRHAYVSDDGQKWDMIEGGDRAVPSRHDCPWEHPDEYMVEWQKERAARAFWSALPEKNQAQLCMWGFIPYEKILAVDEQGDGVVDLPTIFVSFDSTEGPFIGYWGEFRVGEQVSYVLPKEKIIFFPDTFPEPPQREMQIADE